MPQSKRRAKHPWYKCKGYLHFDFALTCREAEDYVTKPDNILRHRFSPLIHYNKIARKVKRDKVAEREYKASGKSGPKPKLIVKEKPRNIFYTGHIDGYIYSYYAHILQKKYEEFLAMHALKENAIAYRSVSKNGVKFCNIHFASEVFDYIEASGGCRVLCFDISKFFDRLSTDILKKNWARVLGEEKLPGHHFKVFNSLINFTYVEEGRIIDSFKKSFEVNPRQHGLDKESGGSKRNRICDYRQLRELGARFKANKKSLLKRKTNAGITGIPQGSALSGLLSNIFMIDFDFAVKAYAESKGGLYCRYSDDIMVVMPPNVAFDEVQVFVAEKLAACCGSSIKLNNDKTEQRTYQKGKGNLFEVVDRKGLPAQIQYLGFHFDGVKRTIRTSSISKDRWKIIHTLRRYKRNGKINMRDVRKERSFRVINPFDATKSKGFIYYARRSADVHKDIAIINQVKKDDRFIKRAMAREL